MTEARRAILSVYGKMVVKPGNFTQSMKIREYVVSSLQVYWVT
jgi:hypothetical protein